MSYQLWQLTADAPAFIGARDDRDAVEKLRRTLALGTTTVIARDGVVLGAANASEKQVKVFRSAVAAAWRESGGADPEPLPTPTDAPPSQPRTNGLHYGRGTGRATAASSAGDDDEEESPVSPKTARPATVRPPLPRRRVKPVAPEPAVVPGPAAAPAVAATDDSAPSECPVPECSRAPQPWTERCDVHLRPLCTSHRALAHRAAREKGIDYERAVAHVVDRGGKCPTRYPRPATKPPRAPTPARATLPAPAAPADESAQLQLQLQRERAVDAEAKLAQVQRLLDTVARERDGYRGQAEGLTTDLDVARRDLATTTRMFNEWSGRHQADLARLTDERDVARRDAAAHLVRAVDAESQRDAVARDRVTQVEQLRAQLTAREEEVINEGDRALRAEAEAERLCRRSVDDFERGRAAGREEAQRVCEQAAEVSRQLGSALDESAQLREKCDLAMRAWGAASAERDSLRERLAEVTRPALDEEVLQRVAAAAARTAVRTTRTDMRLRALAAMLPGGVDELERVVLGVSNLLRQTEGT